MKENSNSFSWLEWAREYKKVKYKGTLQTTHLLFLQGMNLEEIAKKRNIKEETVERQFVALIVKGLVHVADIINEEKIKKILHIVKNNNKLSIIKEELGEKYSYFEIKAVIASLGVSARRRSEQ